MTTESELKDDVRQLTGYTSTKVLSEDGLDTAYRTAKRHIRVRKNLPADYSWFDSDKGVSQEALFWFTCLFCKVEKSELDAQGLQAGAVDEDILLAKDDDSVTTWYRNANQALKALKSSNIIMATSPVRDEREYKSDAFSRESGGGSSGDDLSL